MDSSVLREVLKIGTYKLFDEDQVLKSRANTRTRVQWLRQNREKPSRLDEVQPETS